MNRAFISTFIGLTAGLVVFAAGLLFLWVFLGDEGISHLSLLDGLEVIMWIMIAMVFTCSLLIIPLSVGIVWPVGTLLLKTQLGWIEMTAISATIGAGIGWLILQGLSSIEMGIPPSISMVPIAASLASGGVTGYFLHRSVDTAREPL